MDSVFEIRYQRPDSTEISLGFCSTLPAAKAGIELHQRQPAYRDYPDGFSIDSYDLDKTFSFKNDSSEPIEFVIELWASSVLIPPGSTADGRYPCPRDRDDTSKVEQRGKTIVFWCSGPTFEVDIDGVRIDT